MQPPEFMQFLEISGVFFRMPQINFGQLRSFEYILSQSLYWSRNYIVFDRTFSLLTTISTGIGYCF